jgi:ABC-type amino acid transport substrate-binding protein
MDGVNLTIAIRPAGSDPFVYEDIVNGVPKFSGYAIDVIDRICIQLGCTYNFYRLNDTSSGTTVSQAPIKIPGVSMAAGTITITAARAKVVDCTQPYFYLGLRTAILTEAEQTQTSASVFAFLDPMTWQIWAIFFAFIIMSGTVLGIDSHGDEQFGGEEVNMAESIGFGIYYSYMLSVQRMIYEPEHRAPFSYLFFVGVQFVFFLFGALFLARLASYLIASKVFSYPIQDINQNEIIDLSDIVNALSGICLPTGSSIAAFFNLNYPSATYVSCPSTLACLDMVVKGQCTGFVYDAPILESKARTTYQQLTVIGEKFYDQGYGFTFPPGSPYTAYWNSAIVYLHEQGFYDFLEDKYFPPIYTEDNAPTPYMLDDCKGLFLVASSGIGIIVGLHILQKIYLYLRASKNVQDSPESSAESLAVTDGMGVQLTTGKNGEMDRSSVDNLESLSHLQSRNQSQPQPQSQSQSQSNHLENNRHEDNPDVDHENLNIRQPSNKKLPPLQGVVLSAYGKPVLIPGSPQ